MKQGWNIRSIFGAHLRTGLAVFFLLFVGVDIICPPDCCERLDNLSASSSIPAQDKRADSATNLRVAGEDVHRSPSDQSPDKNQCDDDCCFGCAHMLPTISFSSIAVIDLKSPANILAGEHLPSPPLQSTYHPPRFA
jgi:hypothetical protein